MVTEQGMGSEYEGNRDLATTNFWRRYVYSLLAKTSVGINGVERHRLTCKTPLQALPPLICKANCSISVRDMPGTERARNRRHKDRAEGENLLGG